MTDDKPKQLPQCEGRVTAKDGSDRRCSNTGFHCWVSGSFGRLHKVLCHRCMARLKERGWTVRYQIEGDNPPEAKEA